MWQRRVYEGVGEEIRAGHTSGSTHPQRDHTYISDISCCGKKECRRTLYWVAHKTLLALCFRFAQKDLRFVVWKSAPLS